MDFFLIEAPAGSEAAAQADLAFHLGAPSNPGSTYIAQAGWEDLIVLINASNPLSNLTKEQLYALFSGQVRRWEALSSASIAFMHEVQAWSYPASDELRQAFEDVIFQAGPNQAQAMLAPDPQAMLEAVASDESAIGYVPGSWLKYASTDLTENLKVVSIDSELEEAFHLPVLVGSASEPQGAARALLVCLSAK